MDYKALKAVISAYPTYETATDQELLDYCNEVVRSDTKTAMPNETILAVILSNRAEFTALAAGAQQIVRDILYIGDSVPTAAGEPARDTLVSIFGAQSNTIQSLLAAVTFDVTRAEDAGLVGEIEISDIRYARNN